MGARKTLTPQEALAASVGVELEDVSIPAEAVAEAVAATVEAEAQAETEVEAKVEVAAEVAADPQLDLLKAQVKEKDGELLQANVKLAQATEKLDALQATLAPFKEIVAKSVNTMQVALNGAQIASADMDSTVLLSEYNRVAGLYAANYKVGGISAAGNAEGDAKPVVDPRHMARVNAVRFNK